MFNYVANQMFVYLFGLLCISILYIILYVGVIIPPGVFITLQTSFSISDKTVLVEVTVLIEILIMFAVNNISGTDFFFS